MKVSARQLVKFNLLATAAWICLIAPSLLWWKSSILWVIMMSIWANVVGHFSAYIAARAEEESATNPSPNSHLTDADKEWILTQLALVNKDI